MTVSTGQLTVDRRVLHAEPTGALRILYLHRCPLFDQQREIADLNLRAQGAGLFSAVEKTRVELDEFFTVAPRWE